MKRLLGVGAALAVLAAFPATAGAAELYGVAIAKDAKRKTIVVATAKGAVKTIRVRRQLAQIRVGQRIHARANALADGTLSATRVARLGRAKQVRFGAVVVRHDRRLNRLIVSGGRSVFAVRLLKRSRALSTSGDGFQPGDRIVCEAKIHRGGLATGAEGVNEIGHVTKLELEGIYLFRSRGGFDLAVVHQGLVHVQVPSGVSLPELKPGDEIVLLVTVEENGSFTLVRIAEEDEGDEGEKDDDGEDDAGELTVAGAIEELSASSITVRPEGDGAPVTCQVPRGISLEGFAVGDRVKLHCHLDDGEYFLAALKSDRASVGENGSGELAVEGVISELDDAFVRVQPGGDRPSARCDVREGVDLSGFAPGDRVKLYCHFQGGRLMLAKLRSATASVIVEH